MEEILVDWGGKIYHSNTEPGFRAAVRCTPPIAATPGYELEQWFHLPCTYMHRVCGPLDLLPVHVAWLLTLYLSNHRPLIWYRQGLCRNTQATPVAVLKVGWMPHAGSTLHRWTSPQNKSLHSQMLQKSKDDPYISCPLSSDTSKAHLLQQKHRWGYLAQV